MPRFRFAVEYFGAPYAGWQLQENATTVQSELERALATVLRQAIRITGAGRTDAGVHALGQVAHFDFEGEIDTDRLMHSMNALTRPHIQIRALEPCSENFHARFSALSRRYLYRIALRPLVMLHEWSWHPGFALNPELFATELKSALGDHDFTNFSIPRNDGKSTRCVLKRTEIETVGNFLHVHIEADRFLHKMVRSLIGASYDVARGAHEPGLINSIFENRFKGQRFWAPPQGLCLQKVNYPDYDPE